MKRPPTALPDLDDPDVTLSDLFRISPATAAAFLRRGMLCPGCPITPFHTITEACQAYDFDEAVFRAEVSGLARAAGQL